jgi:hypothetical protein
MVASDVMANDTTRSAAPNDASPGTQPGDGPDSPPPTDAPVARASVRVGLRLGALLGAVALGASLWGGAPWREPGRDAGLAAALERRGLRVDRGGILWLEQPPIGLWRAAAGSVPVVVRAAPVADEPADIFLVQARLSPDGVLLGVGEAYNLTDTSAVDEQRPVGHGSRFAFVDRSMVPGPSESRVRLYDLSLPAVGDDASEPGGAASAADEDSEGARAGAPWTRLQRIQAAITRWQQTGRLAGVGRWSYTVQPPAPKLNVSLDDGALRIEADGRRAEIPAASPLQAPDWLAAEQAHDVRPGNLVTWAVDRVRSIPWVGDETMQTIKAIAFSGLDVLLRGREAVTGDTGAQDIATDLGEDALAEPAKAIPVDPEIGFPPPKLELWVSPALAGEGEWNARDDDPFIQTLPGLPPAFVTTFIRSDRLRKTSRVYIALWDPRQVELHTMAGVAEPKSATGDTGPGTIPRAPEVMRRVAAACNAGFQSLHGEFGMMSDGMIYLPPKPYGATVAVLRDGSTAFGTWPNDATVPADMLSFRQNLTPMVLDGAFNPYGRTWWGGTPSDWEDKTHTTRTGICLTKESFVAYFYGGELSPEALGQAMIQARCSHGIALDMNAGHSGLEFYRVAAAADMPALAEPLRGDWEREGDVPGMDGWTFRARRLIRGMGLMYFPRYIKREGRDYFYMTLRHLLPGPPLPPAKEGQAAPAWQVKGLPQHGFPYALATTETELGGGTKVRLLKIDPRMLTTAAPSGNAAPTSAPLAASPERDAGSIDDGAAPSSAQRAATVVALGVSEPPSGEQPLSLWLSEDAFALSVEPPVPEALRVAWGTGGSGRAAAARPRRRPSMPARWWRCWSNSAWPRWPCSSSRSSWRSAAIPTSQDRRADLRARRWCGCTASPAQARGASSPQLRSCRSRSGIRYRRSGFATSRRRIPTHSRSRPFARPPRRPLLPRATGGGRAAMHGGIIVGRDPLRPRARSAALWRRPRGYAYTAPFPGARWR